MSNPEHQIPSANREGKPNTVTRRVVLAAIVGGVAAVLTRDHVPAEVELLGPPVEPNIYAPAETVEESVDLIDAFTSLDGARRNRMGLFVAPTGQIVRDKHSPIRHKDSPIALFDKYLEVENDFWFSSKLVRGQGFSYNFYGELPRRTDDDLVQASRIQATIETDKLVIDRWLALGKWPTRDVYDLPPETVTTKRNFEMISMGGELHFSINGLDLGEPLPGLDQFKSGKIFLGLDAGEAPAFVTEIAAGPMIGGTLRVVDVKKMRSLSAGGTGMAAEVEKRWPRVTRGKAGKPFGKFVGQAVNAEALVGDPRYQEVAESDESNLWTATHIMKPSHTRPTEGGPLRLQKLNGFVDFARDPERDKELHFHTLVFHDGSADWERNLKTGSDADDTYALKLLEKNIVGTLAPFKGKFVSIDIFNEIAKGEFYNTIDVRLQEDNPYFRILGEKLIDFVAGLVHDIDPDITMVINDNGVEAHKSRKDFYLGLFKRAYERGVPQMAMGLQMHINNLLTDSINDYDLTGLCGEFAEIDTPVRFSEFDATSDSGLNEQAMQFGVAARLLKHSNVMGINYWELLANQGAGSRVGLLGLVPATETIYNGNAQKRLRIANAISSGIRGTS